MGIFQMRKEAIDENMDHIRPSQIILDNKYEQGGSERANYEKQTFPELSKILTSEFGREFSKSSLENMRQYFIEYSTSTDQISQTVSGKFSYHTPEKNSILQDQNGPNSSGFYRGWAGHSETNISRTIFTILEFRTGKRMMEVV